ncbi:MAG TPA: glycoside hydrolase family 71/99-like protein [Bacteroidales bacterium]|nr:glycoside hydrolase family 71/99-like protein [Bacteroidales bacterium]
MSNLKSVMLLTVSLLSVMAFAGTKHGLTSAHTTINGKILCGYQGWFAAPTDGANLSWKHYSINTKSGQLFEPGACSIDLWPDMHEYDANESYQTAFTDPDGSKAKVYSSYKMKTSLLHFRWMEEYGIDGVILQRFVTNIRNSGSLRNFNDTVMMHTFKAAKAYGRAVCIMYDMTSMKSADTAAVKNDWKRLVDTYRLTSGGDDQPYLYHKGKPMICLWGVGFDDGRHDTVTSPASAYSMDAIRGLVQFFKNDPDYGGCSVLLGVNYTWRTKTNKPFIDDHLNDIIKMSDMINPWLVGRLRTVNDMSSFGVQIQGDLLWCNNNGIEYIPCAFPGFSWLNMAYRDSSKGRTVISRDKGNFIWRQFETAITKGVQQIYATMFDEIDEGTALYKVTNSPPNNLNDNNLPNISRVGDYPVSVFQTLEGLSSDYYLWLVGEASRMLRKEYPVTPTIPYRSDLFSLGGVTLACEPLSDGKYKITYTGTLEGRFFCSDPYVVAYGAPTYGKTIDSRYFGKELTTGGVVVNGSAGQVVTVIRTDANLKALGAGSIVLQTASNIKKTKSNPIIAYYDKTQHQLVLESHFESNASNFLSIYDSAGCELLRKLLQPEDKYIQIPVYLQRGVCLVRTSGFNGNFTQKININ